MPRLPLLLCSSSPGASVGIPMITVTEIIGAANDPRIAERLHQLEHHDRVEYLTIQGFDIERRRLRGRTDKGTDVAVALFSNQRPRKRAGLILREDPPIIVP